MALLCWSGSDLFSKIGCRDNDKYAHLKMVIAVGVVMGLHAAFEIFVQGTSVTWHIIWTYLPVSLLYIVSMALGYVGLRYIELSISSPICNSSGALVAVLCLITGTLDESIQGGMRIAVIGAVAPTAGSTRPVRLPTLSCSTVFPRRRSTPGCSQRLTSAATTPPPPPTAPTS